MSPELSGIVVVDKPDGISSARVVSRVKRVCRAKKVGHTGTLDPSATGVLICCINRATRLSRFFLKGDKAYEADLLLGVTTNTQDETGTVIARRSIEGISQKQIRDAAARFVGVTDQIPPVYSALKHHGTPLYKLARKGQAVEKPARTIRIYDLKILSVKLPVVRFSVSCSSGTYIRTLCADLGRELGCGAHLKRLRRTGSSGFTLDDAIGLEKLEQLDANGLENAVIPMNESLPFMPAIVIDKRLADKIRNGMKLYKTDISAPSMAAEQDAFKVIDGQGRLVAILAHSTGRDSYNYCCVF